MTHDEWSLAAYLEGDLDDREAAAWDEHLLECAGCTAAVQESHRGRTLAASLRDTAPAGLRHRVEDAVRRRRRYRRPASRRRGLAAASVGAVAVLIAAAMWLIAGPLAAPRSDDPESIALVLRLAADGDELPPATAEDGVVVTRLRVDGQDVVVARSEQVFPMLEGAISLADDAGSPWLARRGEVSLLCFSRPAATLLAGRAAPDRLAEIAAALGHAVPVGRNQTGPGGVSEG